MKKLSHHRCYLFSRLYITIHEEDLAISMYKEQHQVSITVSTLII